MLVWAEEEYLRKWLKTASKNSAYCGVVRKISWWLIVSQKGHRFETISRTEKEYYSDIRMWGCDKVQRYQPWTTADDTMEQGKTSWTSGGTGTGLLGRSRWRGTSRGQLVNQRCPCTPSCQPDPEPAVEERESEKASKRGETAVTSFLLTDFFSPQVFKIKRTWVNFVWPIVFFPANRRNRTPEDFWD